MKRAFLAPALIAVAALALPSAAQAAPLGHLQPRELGKKSFTVYGTFTGRTIVTSGVAGGIGDLTIATGKVTDTSGNGVGTLTTVMRVVGPGGKSDSELRDTQSQVQFKDGSIFAQAVNEDPKGAAPKTLHIMPVIGGTGAYATARGTLNIYPVGNSGKYLMAYDVFVDKKLTTYTKSFDAPQFVNVDDTAHKGISSVTMAYATGDDSLSYLSATTRIGASAYTSDLRVDLPAGSVFARAITPSKDKAIVYAVLGGTREFAGYRGELTLGATGRGITMKLAGPSGAKGKPITWTDTIKSKFAAPVTGASFASSLGDMTDAKGKKSGTFEATAITYPTIAGITPVISMGEQTFVTCTLLITGMSVSASDTELPAVGGTGDCGGAAGSSTAKALAPGRWAKSATFWR